MGNGRLGIRSVPDCNHRDRCRHRDCKHKSGGPAS